MNIALAQINPTVGNLEENYLQIMQVVERGKKEHVDLLIFPELAVTGYPPKDLLLKKKFVQKNKEIVERIAFDSRDIALILGFIDIQDDVLYNAAAIIENGKLVEVYHKIHLPNYDVFDERRYFKPGDTGMVISIFGKKIGVTICEDIWVENGPISWEVKQGAELIINISASPFHAGKATIREELLSRRAREHHVPIVYLNLVGGQDDLIFDGRSYVFNKNGKKIVQAQAFADDFVVFNLERAIPLEREEKVIKDTHDALVLGIKDYFRKNNFKKAVIGLSGGIDSALTAALAVTALGKENVLGITMPSKFSSSGSVTDSEQLARNLGIPIHTIPLQEIYSSYAQTLEPHFAETSFSVAEENIQARIRGNLLMAFSNKFGYLVLATGNKSELSVGYATLYGDMAGGLAVISDVFKTTVYLLSEYINKKAGREIIPQATITKEPSAELRENQRDSDSLPVYAILDPILRLYVEEERSKEEIMQDGFAKEVVEKVISLVDRNEYKRQQAAIGFKITPRAFGSGRRMPITNGWKG